MSSCGHRVALLGAVKHPARLADCREEVKVPPANTAGVHWACWLVSQPCDLVLHGLSGSCGLSCLLEAGGWAAPTLPWVCAGFLYHPVPWKVLSGSACPASAVSWLLETTFPVLVELVGVGWFVRAWAAST